MFERLYGKSLSPGDLDALRAAEARSQNSRGCLPLTLVLIVIIAIIVGLLGY